MVLSNNGAGKFSDTILVQLIEFAEDMRGRPADDKQKPNGGMIRKHLCIPCSSALELGLLAPDMVCGGMHLLKPRVSHNPMVRGQEVQNDSKLKKGSGAKLQATSCKRAEPAPGGGGSKKRLEEISVDS